MSMPYNMIEFVEKEAGNGLFCGPIQKWISEKMRQKQHFEPKRTLKIIEKYEQTNKTH